MRRERSGTPRSELELNEGNIELPKQHNLWGPRYGTVRQPHRLLEFQSYTEQLLSIKIDFMKSATSWEIFSSAILGRNRSCIMKAFPDPFWSLNWKCGRKVTYFRQKVSF